MPLQDSCCTTNTIAEITDRFLLRAGIEKRKHYGRYLVLAEECWQDIFQNTLWVIKSVWMPTKAGNPYNYVNMPCDCQRLLSVGVEDKCGLIQPLYYNQQINVVAKPTTKKCGCTSNCGCSGLCESVGSTITTSELIFTINSVNYYKTCWLQYCPNGDILKWCRTPVKKYNNVLGDAGDYDPDDYNNDWLIGNPPFSDYTIVYVETQEKICHLETLPCGCPAEIESNEQAFLDCCGYWVNWSCRNKKKYCKQFSPDINSNHYGNVKVSDCGNKIYYKPSESWKKVYRVQTPDYLLVNYQSTGTSPGAETVVPIYARNLMYAMLDRGRKEYNSSYSLSEKNEACYKVTAAKQEVMGYLSPVSLNELSSIQDAPILW